MHDVSRLSLIASRLLNLLMLHGEQINDWPKTKIMEMVGTNRAVSFREARNELESEGFVLVERIPGRVARLRLSVAPVLSSAEGAGQGWINKYINILYDPTQTSLPSQSDLEGSTESVSPKSPGSTESVLGGSTESVLPLLMGDTENALPGPMGDTESVLPGLPGDTESDLPGPLGHTESVLTLMERCRLADYMDDSGDVMGRNSPFQKRRRVQVPLVVEAYADLFPQDEYPLMEKTARQWLTWNEDSAVTVYESLQDIKRRKPNLESPKGYIKAAFEGEAQRRPRATASSPVSSAAPSRPTKGAAAYRPGEPLPPPDDELLALSDEGMEVLEQLKRERGWLE